MASDRRRQQVAQRIRQKVSELLLFEVKDPRASFVTVTGVEISKDLAVAKVRWSVFETSHRSRVEHMLEHARGFFRTEVARDLQLRTAPELRFEFDEGLARAQRIEQVLREVLPAADAPEAAAADTDADADADAEVDADADADADEEQDD